jgi:hypothetical protein
VTSSNTIWIAVLVIVAVYIIARMLRSRRTEGPADAEQVRYLIRSANAGAAEELGSRSGLILQRYYFRNTELETGPSDPTDFYDELFIDLEDPDSSQKFQNTIHVATPRGLERVMVEENWDSVIGGELLIVRKYDQQTILNAAVEHLQEIYEAQVQMK